MSKLSSGVVKCVLGTILAVCGAFLMIRGCSDVREATQWHDETEDILTDEHGEPILISE